MAPASMSKTSGVFDYVEWFIGNASEEQRGRFTRSPHMDLGADLGAALIAREAMQRAMQKHGLY
eukprot:6764258-Lingulodinium_polyedra.AAC.1